MPELRANDPSLLRLLAGLLLSLALGGCAAVGPPRVEDPDSGMHLKNLGKSDIDTVADTAMAMLEQDLRQLTKKLYARNPRELARSPGATLAKRDQQLFDAPGELIYDEVEGRTSTNAMLLALDPAFQGDRVFALMVGLVDMIHRSYGYRSEFFMLDSLDEQKLYNSARNIEILVWRLKHRTGPGGKPLILTDGPGNLSYERLFGKMIAIQDLMAEVTASRTNRSITRVVQGVASMVFLPI